MKVLLTGGTGFIGSRLVKRLMVEKIEVVALVRNTSKTESLEALGVSLFKWDGCNFDCLLRLFARESFTGVIHLAAMYRSAHEPNDISAMVDTNITLPVLLLDAASKTNKPWFLNTGTIWQHFNAESYNPVNLYASTKQGAEVLAKFYVEEFEMRVLTLKIPDVYGPADPRPKLLNLWTRMLETGASLDMSGGEQLVDLIHVDDVVEAFVYTAKAFSVQNSMLDRDSYFLSSGAPVSLRDVATLFEEISKKKLSIRWGRKPYRTREILSPCLDAPILPGWSPKIMLRDGLRCLLVDSDMRIS